MLSRHGGTTVDVGTIPAHFVTWPLSILGSMRARFGSSLADPQHAMPRHTRALTNFQNTADCATRHVGPPGGNGTCDSGDLMGDGGGEDHDGEGGVTKGRLWLLLCKSSHLLNCPQHLLRNYTSPRRRLD